VKDKTYTEADLVKIRKDYLAKRKEEEEAKRKEFEEITTKRQKCNHEYKLLHEVDDQNASGYISRYKTFECSKCGNISMINLLTPEEEAGNRDTISIENQTYGLRIKQ